MELWVQLIDHVIIFIFLVDLLDSITLICWCFSIFNESIRFVCW